VILGRGIVAVLGRISMQQREGLAVPSLVAVDKKRQVRRSWTIEQKRKIVAESQVAGTSLVVIAQRHGIRTALIGSWRRQLLRCAKLPARRAQFAAVRMSAAFVEGMIEIDLSGGCVRVHGVVDGQMLREVLAATR
jgi:transposase